MSLNKQIEFLKVQIIENERFLKMVANHPIMSISIKAQIKYLKEELEKLPKESFKPKVNLLFSGNAVFGSQGIKSDFISKILKPFQDMVNTQFARIRGKKRASKKITNSDLYLTAFPIGSFGVELCQLESNDLFDSNDISQAIKDILILVSDASQDDETFERAVENTPKKNLNSLKQFLKEISDEKSILKMESNELGIELSDEEVNIAFNRVANIIPEETEEFITCNFRGILLDSGKYEAQSLEGKKISGYISDTLSEDELIEYDKKYLNQQCIIHFKKNKVKFATGREKTDYELLDILNSGDVNIENHHE